MVIDFSDCISLDSTLLGTLYGLAMRDAGRGGLRLQNVPAEIRRLFVELALEPALAAVAVEATPLPAELSPLRAKGDRSAQDLLLHAHEILAAINKENAAQFGGVVEALRHEPKA